MTIAGFRGGDAHLYVMKYFPHLPLDFFSRRRVRSARVHRIRSLLRVVTLSSAIFRRKPRRILCRIPIAG